MCIFRKLESRAPIKSQFLTNLERETLRCQAEFRVEHEPRAPILVSHGHGDLSTNGSAASVGNGSIPETTSTERVFRTVPGGELDVDAFFKRTRRSAGESGGS